NNISRPMPDSMAVLVPHGNRRRVRWSVRGGRLTSTSAQHASFLLPSFLPPSCLSSLSLLSTSSPQRSLCLICACVPCLSHIARLRPRTLSHAHPPTLVPMCPRHARSAMSRPLGHVTPARPHHARSATSRPLSRVVRRLLASCAALLPRVLPSCTCTVPFPSHAPAIFVLPLTACARFRLCVHAPVLPAVLLCAFSPFPFGSSLANVQSYTCLCV
ncbi:hypothetical protein EVG20_g357, partial [Dentipellis fragilis]